MWAVTFDCSHFTLWSLQVNTVWMLFVSGFRLFCILTVFCKYSCLVCVRRWEDVCRGGRVAAGGERKHRGGPELPQWAPAAPAWPQPGTQTGTTVSSLLIYRFAIDKTGPIAQPFGCLFSTWFHLFCREHMDPAVLASLSLIVFLFTNSHTLSVE